MWIDTLKQDRGFINRVSTKSKFKNKMRRVFEEYDCYLDGYRPFKRACHQGDKYEDLFITSDYITFK